MRQTLVLLLIQAAFAGGDENAIRVDFDGHTFDRWLFRTEVGESGGRWDLTGSGLRAVLPAGTAGRPPIRFVALFHLESDFQIVAQYAIHRLPRPRGKSGSNNVEIAVAGPDGFATVFRTADAAVGDGNGYYVDYADQRETVYQHVPSTATTGQLSVQRVGTKLVFSRGEVAGSLVEMGSVEFGREPITEVVFQALANNTTDALDVQFDRIEIRADRIIRLRSPSPVGWGLWLWGVIVASVGAAGFWVGRLWLLGRSGPKSIDASHISSHARSRAVPRQLPRGFSIIELVVIIGVIGILLALVLPAVQASRESARRAQCQNHLRQIGLALQSYVAAKKVYPFGVGGGGPPGVGGAAARWSAQSQLLPYLEWGLAFNAINFSFVPWAHHPVHGPINTTALGVHIDTFLCPSDSDNIAETYGLAHNSYRACAGTQPYNLKNDSPDGTGKNNGLFWYQSSTRPGWIRDGASSTALFSERCLGNSSSPDPKGDYYLTAPSLEACRIAGPTVTPRHESFVEWSGQRWADGNVFYTRYQHVLPPNQVSCNFGTEDYDAQVVSTASSRHPGGVNLLMADASIRFVSDTIAPSIWTALGSIAGGEPVGNAEF